MSQSGGNKRNFFQKINDRYRFVILNDETYEEKASFNLSRLNVFIFLSTVLVVLVLLISSVIILTPVKEYLPGTGDARLQRDLFRLKVRTDSLEIALRQKNIWLDNIRNVIEGNDPSEENNPGNEELRGPNFDTIQLDRIPMEDLMLRQEIESEDQYSIDFSLGENPTNIILGNMHFVSPVTGYVTNEFDLVRQHYGIDIVGPKNSPVKAAMDGFILFDSWTLETGYVVAVQHASNLVTFYKHNSSILKKTGSTVRAGDAIAIMGSSGELTTGPHLHFEIWRNGIPLNPRDFLIFPN